MTEHLTLPSWEAVADGGRVAFDNGDYDEPTSREVTAPETRMRGWVEAHAPAILDAVLAGLHERWEEWREDYSFEDDAERDELMPPVAKPAELTGFLSNATIHYLDLEKDGVPYFGVEMRCSWDDEHDFGAMMHGTRVVGMGGADVAFLSWIAERDRDGR